MTEDFVPARMHIVVGSPWLDAVIKHLQPQAPYQPWSAVSDARPDDGVLVVLDTEPLLILRQVARVDLDGDVDLAIAELDSYWFYNPGIEVAGLEMHHIDLRFKTRTLRSSWPSWTRWGAAETTGAGSGTHPQWRHGHSSSRMDDALRADRSST
jgi:hypothetical protein